jgi:hypothetical protein
VRWYRLYCIDCRESVRMSPATLYCEHRVEVEGEGGVIAAWDQAKADGYWPLEVIETDWCN